MTSKKNKIEPIHDPLLEGFYKLEVDADRSPSFIMCVLSSPSWGVSGFSGNVASDRATYNLLWRDEYAWIYEHREIVKKFNNLIDENA